MNYENKPKEECGIFGIYDRDHNDCSQIVYYALYALQHRGQESCGMALNDGFDSFCYKDLGLVPDVFNEFVLSQLKGSIAIGHVRYSTTGSNLRENAQPLSTKYVKGTLTIAHNGNLVNAPQLRSELEKQGALFHSSNDTETIAYLIAKERLKTGSVEDAVARVIPQLEGSFSLLVMSPKKLIAVRDPHGFRPLCMGSLNNAVVFASESCAFDTIGANFERDVRPGEMVVVSQDGIEYRDDYCGQKTSFCIFEHIYFARPDSIIDGQSVYQARNAAGRQLAKEHPVEADMVIGVPDSGICAAIGYAEESGIPYGEGLIKNKYIGRTFIQPNQSLREKSVNIKLNVVKSTVKGKRIIMVDDSIVRGTTIRNIVTILKDAGATEVHVRISAPPFLWPCFYGTDISDRRQLVAVKHTIEEIRKKIGADTLGYLSVDGLKELVKDSKLDYCDACFTGKYPTKTPKETNKLAFEGGMAKNVRSI